jgi:taurine dioxygenase
MEYEVERLTGTIGARVRGLKLADLADAQIEDVKRIVSEHCVAVFPDQYLQPRDESEFAARLGPTMLTPGDLANTEWENVARYENPGKSRAVTEAWHTDTSFLHRPPAYTILAAAVLPKTGGDTLFLNQYYSYERLSPVMQRLLQGLRVRHIVSGIQRPEEVGDRDVWHPLVRTNPVTGRRALYMSALGRLDKIDGMTRAESRSLLGFLHDHSIAIDRMYRHRWSPGDVLIWDNRCTMHAAAHDYGDEPRTLYRILVQGEAPFEAPYET